MKLNLQFFAEEDMSADIDSTESVEETEAAEQSEEYEETDEAEESAENEAEQKVDVNAIAAAARRKAESEAREAQARIDAEYARRFGNYKNPITGAPIKSQKDYLDALDAQEQLKTQKALQEKGVDPNLINNLVQNNPVVKQASEYMENAKRQEQMNRINADIAELSKLDPSITSLETVPKEVIQKAMDGNMLLTDAYKILNYGKTTEKTAQAIRQGAINEAKGKAHLNPMNGVSTQDNSVEIPKNLRGLWEEMFPNKSWAERKKLYNDTL